MTRLDAAALLVALLGVGGCALSDRAVYKSVPDVDVVLTKSMPIGTARADLEKVLNSQLIDWSYTKSPLEDNSTQLSEKVPNLGIYSGAIYYKLPGSQGFIVLQDFRVILLFGSDDRLERRVVLEEMTGL